MPSNENLVPAPEDLNIEKWKGNNIFIFLIQLGIFIGLIVLSFYSLIIFGIFTSSPTDNLIIWMILLIVFSILGAVAVFSLAIYVLWKKILNSFIKQIIIQFVISIFTGQIVSFILSSIFVGKMGIKMSVVQNLTFFALLGVWVLFFALMVYYANIDFNNVVSIIQREFGNLASSVSSENVGETAEQVSDGEVEASVIDSWIKQITDTFSSVLEGFRIIEDLGKDAESADLI